MQSRVKFVEMITGLAEALGGEMSVAKLSIYEKALSRFSDEQIEAAVNLAGATLKFFPKPVELIELIEGKREDQAVLAWETLLDTMQRVGAYASVLFEDGRIAKTVNLLGGWQQICQTPEANLKFLRLDFLKIFASLSPDTVPEILDGIGNIHNAAHGFLDHVHPARIIVCPSATHRLPAAQLMELASGDSMKQIESAADLMDRLIQQTEKKDLLH